MESYIFWYGEIIIQWVLIIILVIYNISYTLLILFRTPLFPKKGECLLYNCSEILLIVVYPVFKFMENLYDNESSQPLLAGTSSQNDRAQPPEPVVFTTGSNDIPPITGVGDFFREYLVESKKLWYLAGPAIFTGICQYSLGAITQTFSGHVSTIDLAAFSVENSVIAGFCFGVMVINLPFDFCLVQTWTKHFVGKQELKTCHLFYPTVVIRGFFYISLLIYPILILP